MTGPVTTTRHVPKLVAAWALSVAIGTLSSALSAASLYSIRPLEVNDPQIDVFAKGINNRGQVVGYTIDPQGNSHAVLWDEQGIRPLPSLSTTYPFSEAYRINDSGLVVGKATTDNQAAHAVLWDASGITDIGTLPGGTSSFAQDVNDVGVVAGSSDAERGSHAFTWTREGGFVDYGNLVPELSTAVAGFNGVNNEGLMVGTAYVLLSPYNAIMARASDGNLVNLSPPGQFSTGMALAVNDTGTIVGYQNPGSGSSEAAIFHGDGTYQKLGLLGMEESWASDVNRSGVIVGHAFDRSGSRAFVYQDGQMTELLRLVEDSTGWDTLFDATGINDLGQIVGVGGYQGEVRAFVATPVPEPCTLWAAATGLALFAFAWRFR